MKIVDNSENVDKVDKIDNVDNVQIFDNVDSVDIVDNVDPLLPKRLKNPKEITGSKMVPFFFVKLPHLSPQKIENRATREF